MCNTFAMKNVKVIDHLTTGQPVPLGRNPTVFVSYPKLWNRETFHQYTRIYQYNIIFHILFYICIYRTSYIHICQTLKLYVFFMYMYISIGIAYYNRHHHPPTLGNVWCLTFAQNAMCGCLWVCICVWLWPEVRKFTSVWKWHTNRIEDTKQYTCERRSHCPTSSVWKEMKETRIMHTYGTIVYTIYGYLSGSHRMHQSVAWRWQKHRERAFLKWKWDGVHGWGGFII